MLVKNINPCPKQLSLINIAYFHFLFFFSSLFQKWTEPVEKISRELSQAEETNTKNRKRLRGIALAIQSVISLLYLVRSRNNTNIDNTASALSTKEGQQSTKPSSTPSTPVVATAQQPHDDNSINSSPNVSRIPRPMSAMASSPSLSAKRVKPTTPLRTRRNIASAGAIRKPATYDQPDYSLKKGFLKREEKVDTGTLMKKKRVVRSKISVPTTGVRKQIPSASSKEALNNTDETASLVVRNFKDKQVRFRPSSVIDVRVNVAIDPGRPERPGSAQGYRSTSTCRKPVNLSERNVTNVNKKENKTTQKDESAKAKNISSTTAKVDTAKTEEKRPSRPSNQNSADNIVGEVEGVASNGVKLRKKSTPRSSRTNSLMDLPASSSCLSTSKENISKTNINDEKAGTKKVDQQVSSHDSSSISRRNRPVSLSIGNAPSNGKATRKAITPSADEFNRKRLQYRLTDQLEVAKKNEISSSGRMSPTKKNSKFKLSNLSSPRCRSPTRRTKDSVSPTRRAKDSIPATTKAGANSSSTTKENVPEHKQIRSRPRASTTTSVTRDRSVSVSRRHAPIKKTPSVPPASPKKTMRDRSLSASRSSSSSSSSSRKSSSSTPPKPSSSQSGDDGGGSPLIRSKSNHNTPTKNGTSGSWNPGTNILYREPNSLRKPLSPKKRVNSANSSPKHVPRKSTESGKVSITTEVNKRKNITFPNGKKVDRETNTRTTVSVDMNDQQSGGDDGEETKAVKRASLLAKVKTLAQEIGSLSKLDTTPVSEGSSDSMKGDSVTPVRNNSDMMGDVIREETDHFSETEYLSLSERP